MRTRVIALVVLLLSVPAWAWEEPAGFRGIPWGSPVAEVHARLPELKCATECRGTLMIGQIRASTYIFFDSGGMDAVSLTFATQHFQVMKDIFIAHYGAPSTSETTTVQNRMGAQYSNEVLEWSGKRVHIHLERYGSRLTEGQAIFFTEDHERAAEEKRTRQVTSGKKDL